MKKIPYLYSVHELSKLASVSVRTLHYYDEIDLLKPSGIRQNGYRYYEERELLLLQQILFFRELEFPLEEIKKILSNKNFDMKKALLDHRKLIELKKSRLSGLIKTIDKTIKKISNKKTTMKDDELYGSFDKDEMERYAKEAKERWGDSDAYKQSVQRVKGLSKDDYAWIKKDGDELMQKIVLVMDKDPKSKEVQELIEKHYAALQMFYDPNPTLYRGLASMYIDDPRFTAFYEKFAVGLAKFMNKSMNVFCDTLENKTLNT